MITTKHNVTILEQGDELVVALREQEGMFTSPNAAIHISRVGSDDPDFPLKTPHMMIEFLYPYGTFSAPPDKDGMVAEVVCAPHTFIVTGERRDKEDVVLPNSSPIRMFNAMLDMLGGDIKERLAKEAREDHEDHTLAKYIEAGGI